MKTILKSIVVVLAIGFYHSSIYGQSSSAINARNNASWFLGWDGSGSITSGSLEIKNNFGSENINFSTNDGTGTTQKATILDNGNVGIGTATPVYTLQINGTVAAKQFLVEINSQTQDLLALVTELQNEVAELKQKFRCFTQTDSVTSEIKQP